MRIIAGKFRGLRLSAVGKGDPAAHLRPTADRVRESLFNILCHRVNFDGMKVLDLFAGTGALGFEALSRGASHITFVENGRTAQKILSENMRLTKAVDDTKILRCDATRLSQGDPHDVVFLDPPYGKNLGQKALTSALDRGWIASGALIVWEESAPMYHPALTFDSVRKFGDSHISFLTAP